MFFSFLRELLSRRNVVAELTKQDFKAVYLDSYLGILWAFLLPVAMTAIFWFVFQVGFKAQPVANHPYILWLVCGMFPWLFFSDCVTNGMNSIIQNSFVVKKVAFSIGILPLIKILSALIIHLFFIVLTIALFLGYGRTPTIYLLQIPYYLTALVVFVLGLSWLTSSMVIFFRDLKPLIAIVLQMGFYITPIFWDVKMLPEKYHWFIQCNPVYYIVEGYRECFIYKKWFWQNPEMTVYFWSITGFIFICGAIVFRRLRPHFADVI